MQAILPSTSVGQIVAERPQLARIFEELQIDYCCGGKRPLADVCRELGLDAADLARRLANEEAAATSSVDWNSARLTSLCDHIQQTHHDYLRRELPRLSALLDKVVSAHGARHAELVGIRSTFGELRAELEPHMMKEERILFPAIRFLEANRQAQFPFGPLANPIRVMVDEHDHAGDALARLRKLTHDYSPPADACNTYRAMLEGLATLERDMHEHVHKENNILFPRAASLESSLRESTEEAHD